MVKNLFKCRLFFLVLSSFMLCQCAQTVNTSEPVAPKLPTPKKVIYPYKLPTAEYLAQSQRQPEGKQQNLLLAAGRMVSEQHWQQGLAILAHTSDLTVSQENEKNILLAQVALLRDKPEQALNKLDEIQHTESLSLFNRVQYHEVRAQSCRLTGKSSEAIAERIKLEALLSDKKQQSENRRALWLSLINMPPGELKALGEGASAGSELQGWVQLAQLASHYRADSKALLEALRVWQVRFSQHPANAILPLPLEGIADKMLMPPKQIALLLPLSGPFAGPGNAVKEGFMEAYAAAKSTQESVKIKTYDTAKEDSVRVYEQAVNEGAQYIVGPLIKNQVTAVAAIPHPVPTLLLNDAEPKQDNSYSFGLSPANEAIQVALKAHSKGHKRALILAPDSDWGNEVAKAFSHQWAKQGGAVVDSFFYNVSPKVKEDFNKKISYFLQITNSEAREHQVKEILGQDLQFVPSRRQDFDMIFLLAYPSKARQIMPALKYYYTGDVPVYATSSVYSGHANALKDKDLNGIIFCDIPWVFAHQMGVKNWPEQFNSYNRLYALGMDSFALAGQLNQLILFPADRANEQNGILYLKPTQQVARVLEWGQFKNGLAHSLGAMA
jgi:outer membrane PBP1 activator LpoA protein